MSEFLKACRREPTDYTPIWLMRQAGRYQKEYRDIRSKMSFIELCKSPDLAAEVTVFAVEQLGVDAAIIFADILLVLEPLGIGFHFAKDHGPVIDKPVRTAADVDAVAAEIDAGAELSYVMEAIKTTKKSLKPDVPLIGFAGAPFTLASYVVEGGGSRNYYEAKKLMFGCRPRLAMERNRCSSSTSPSSSAISWAFLRSSAPPSTPLSSVAVSPDCELWASSMITAYFRVGRWLLPPSPRSSLSLASCPETNGNFCSVVMMIGTPASSASASWRESSSIFCTTPCRWSNW